MSEKYKVGDSEIPHFVTITVVKWLPILDHEVIINIIIDSLKFCQEKKDLIIHAWCIMPSHLHLIVSCNSGQIISSIIRDFKKFTSVSISREFDKNEKLKKYLKVFQNFAKESIKHQKFKVWQDGYHPIELNTNKLLDQKLDYLHDNPVKAGIVSSSEEYKLSSAADYYLSKKGLLDLSFIE